MKDMNGDEITLKWLTWASRIVTGVQMLMTLLILLFTYLLFNLYLTDHIYSFQALIYGFGVTAFLMVYLISFPLEKQVDKAIDDLMEELEKDSNTQED